jgi:hypothetical protein
MVLVLLGGAWSGYRALAAAPQQGSPPPKTAGLTFKNIQVLKDVPADQLIPTMQFISGSLGVECDFCHVERQFDKDDKPEKKTARLMMEMMFAINKDNFKGERQVTCNTCHRGSPHPQAIPAILAEGPQPEAMEAMHEHEEHGAEMASGQPAMDKFIQASGGKVALDKVTTRVEHANAQIPGGKPLAIDIYTKAPDERVSAMHGPKGDSVTAYNGHEGWTGTPGRPPREMSASDRMAARLDAEAFYPVQFEQEFSEFKLQPHPEKVGDRETTVVIAMAKGQPPVKLYFDQDSGLLLRMVHYTNTALGLNPTQVDFADYREVDGVKTPFRWTIGRPSGSFTIQVEKAEPNVPIDDAKFVKPPSPPPGAPQAPASADHGAAPRGEAPPPHLPTSPPPPGPPSQAPPPSPGN